MRSLSLLFLGLIFLLSAVGAPPASRGWMVLLDEPPVVERYPGRIETSRAASEPYRQHLRQAQSSIRAQIEARDIHVTGAVQHLLNALFVKATPAQAATLRTLPGVKAVVALRLYFKSDQLTLSHVQSAWATPAIGGQSNAGAGLKIAILDTGIDQTHPSFQDSSLAAPAGFPRCDVQSNCAFTTNKVIVARSYVFDLTAGSNPSDPAADSRPDDLSARDLDGHGTAVASVAAGVPSSFQGNSISGVAPKAFLGNYKIFGSPEVNSFASDAGIISALDDAVVDGMDIVNLSLGSPAFGGPLDSGATCGNPAGVACDPVAAAIEQAVTNGQVLVVAAAGNSGATGYQNTLNGAPSFGTVASPAYTPSAVAAGGIQNDISYAQSVEVSGNNSPANLKQIAAFESADGPQLSKTVSAPGVDVAKEGDSTGLLCNPLSGKPLSGSIALVLRGTCLFSIKVNNAQSAGAVGVIFLDNKSPDVTYPGGLGGTQIPSFLVQQAVGGNLKSYVDSNPSAVLTLNPARSQVPASTLDLIPESVASFASRGPATGSDALKPDVSAVATDFLLAAENYDPYGDLFSTSRYATAAGTSFSSPMISGAAALVMQANPSLSPLQIKSALVNTATLSGVQNQSGSGAASLSEVGAGILQAQNAVVSTVQIVPSSVSFGLLSGSVSGSQTLTFTNSGKTAVSLAMSVQQPSGSSGAQVLVNNSANPTVSLPPGVSSGVNVTLSGSSTALPGRYEGFINITGAAAALHIPYMFLVSDGTVFDLLPLYGGGFDGPINQTLPPGEGPLVIRAVDRYGAPVPNASVQWQATTGAGSIDFTQTTTSTDVNGIAFATVALGPSVGTQEFQATVNGLTIPYDGNARLVPAINANGIVDAASFKDTTVAAGSIVSVFGTALSDITSSASYLPLPLGINGVAMSFDVPSAGISVPGRFYFVSPNQMNVQVPWELSGQSSAIVKVIINQTYSAEYTLPLATYSPGIFAGNQNGQLIAAALNSANKVVNAGNPVARGDTVQLFLNGLGPVNSQPASGATVVSAASTTTSTPTITIGGQTASVSFSGLAPDFVGVYQVNAVVPQNIGTGLQTMTCSIGGVTSQPVRLPVK